MTFAQDARVPLNIYSTWKAERNMSDSAFSVHPEMKPYSTWTTQKFEEYDGEDKHWRYASYRLKEHKNYVEISPRVNATGTSESGKSAGLALESYLGANISADLQNKLKLNADVIAGYNEPVSYLSKITDSLHAVPGYSYANRQGGFGYHQSTINLTWHPSDRVELSAGRGKHFIGEGYRSLFLSDYAPNYNFLKTDINVWRIKYMVLYTQMRSPESYPSAFYPLKNKYASMHYLSLNVTKWCSVGAFEAVVWESEDSVQNREFDINYANPIIFFRPIEYGLGSSDNSLLGFSSTIRPAKGLSLYGQLVLDEFVMKEVLAPVFAKVYPDSVIKNGWFGNKQAFQLGIKYHNPFGWRNATVLAEVNVVRPYTYSHANQNQTYTHLAHPLAHPFGSNVIEWVAVAMWQPTDAWNFGLRTNYARKGYTTSLRNMGEDPARSSADIISSGPTHGLYMLQGRLVDVGNVRLEAAYTLIDRWNLRLESALHYRSERTSLGSNDSFMFSLGIRTALWNDYKDL